MDAFMEWLESNRGSLALRDASYKKVIQKEKKLDRAPYEDNTELSTLGDAVLKLALCDLLWGAEEGLTVKKAKYESDKVLVKVIAKHYDILSFLQYDKEDKKINYDYQGETHKYIATAIEACLGAIWQEKKDYSTVYQIVAKWKDWIDEAYRNREL